MKNVLAIEIKDNKTIVTVAKIANRNYNLLLHKSYGSKPLGKYEFYDSSIISKIKKDLIEMNIYNDLDEKYLTINTKRVATTIRNFEYKYNTDIEEAKEKYHQELLRQEHKVHVNNLMFSKDTDIALTKQNITAIIEAMSLEYYNNILDWYKREGLVFTKIIPITDCIKNAVYKKGVTEEVKMSVLVEEKFTQLTWLENGRITSAIKWDTGLSDIYEHITTQMNLKSKQEAKILFKSFGSIPPEDVVDDKVIHQNVNGKERNVYTKKDLSRYITEKVNELFANVKYHIDSVKAKDKEVRIVFNGEIKTLMGFRKYASKSFDETNITKYKTDIIGLNPETEFVTIGMLLETKENLEEIEIQNKKISMGTSLLKRAFRMYDYI